MSTNAILIDHRHAGHDTTSGAIANDVRAGVSGFLAKWRARRAERALCEELSGLGDRMLLDIGLTPEEVARLRAGDIFTPQRHQN